MSKNRAQMEQAAFVLNLTIPEIRSIVFEGATPDMEQASAKLVDAFYQLIGGKKPDGVAGFWQAVLEALALYVEFRVFEQNQGKHRIEPVGPSKHLKLGQWLAINNQPGTPDVVRGWHRALQHQYRGMFPEETDFSMQVCGMALLQTVAATTQEMMLELQPDKKKVQG